MAKRATKRRSCFGSLPSPKRRATERTVTAAPATSISELPVDIISDILLRNSDIKSIIRCRRVCKTWRHLLHQLYFTQSQLSRGCLSRSLIFHRRSKGPLNPSEFGILELDDPACLRSCNVTVKFRSEIFLPHKDGRLRVIGACNGLICLNINHDILVCNPILQGRQHFTLPRPKSIGKDWTVGIGFGYSSVSDKYKVLRCVRTTTCWNSIGIEICTVGSDDTWRTIEGFKGQSAPYTQFCNEIFVFVKGTLYWVCSEQGSKLLYCFDVETEELKISPLPSEIKGRRLNLGADNYLCLTEWCLTNHINVWVMNDDQHMESWTLKCTVEVSYSRRLHMPNQLVKIWKDGTMLMIFRDKTLGFYDPQKGVVEKVKSNGVRFWPAELTYIPSFVSPPWMLSR